MLLAGRIAAGRAPPHLARPTDRPTDRPLACTHALPVQRLCTPNVECDLAPSHSCAERLFRPSPAQPSFPPRRLACRAIGACVLLTCLHPVPMPPLPVWQACTACGACPLPNAVRCLATESPSWWPLLTVRRAPRCLATPQLCARVCPFLFYQGGTSTAPRPRPPHPLPLSHNKNTAASTPPDCIHPW